MEMLSIERELMGNSYPGRGIIIGKSADVPATGKWLWQHTLLWEEV